MVVNVVELIQESDADCAFDQPCKFGHRVEGHATYCHNDAWKDAPRKCRRSWYTDGELKDEDCPGYQPNPAYGNVLNPSPIDEPLCSQCGGVKLIVPQEGKSETCPRCMGDGAEPTAIEMTQYEQDTLEISSVIARHHGERFVRIAENDVERNAITQLCGLDLIMLRSATYTGGASVYLLEITAKGQAVMRANWAAAKRTT